MCKSVLIWDLFKCSTLTLYSLAWTTWTCIFAQFKWLVVGYLHISYTYHVSEGHLGDAAFVKERLHLRQVFHVKEPTAANLKRQYYIIIGKKESEAFFMIGETDDMFSPSYLEFCIHSTCWMYVLQMCMAPIIDPLPLQNFTSFTISANLRGTYMSAGSSKNQCQTFFAFLPKQVTFSRKSQTCSWELSLSEDLSVHWLKMLLGKVPM